MLASADTVCDSPGARLVVCSVQEAFRLGVPHENYTCDCLVPCLVVSAACNAPGTDVNADKEQIAQNIAAWKELGKTGDTEKILTYFADDVMIFPAGQPVLKGRDAVRRLVEIARAPSHDNLGRPIEHHGRSSRRPRLCGHRQLRHDDRCDRPIGDGSQQGNTSLEEGSGQVLERNHRDRQSRAVAVGLDRHKGATSDGARSPARTTQPGFRTRSAGKRHRLIQLREPGLIVSARGRSHAQPRRCRRTQGSANSVRPQPPRRSGEHRP